jgi:hypothetical protein
VRDHPPATCRSSGIDHWRASCLERCPRGSAGGHAEKGLHNRHLAAWPTQFIVRCCPVPVRYRGAEPCELVYKIQPSSLLGELLYTSCLSYINKCLPLYYFTQRGKRGMDMDRATVRRIPCVCRYRVAPGM